MLALIQIFDTNILVVYIDKRPSVENVTYSVPLSYFKHVSNVLTTVLPKSNFFFIYNSYC